MTCKTKSLLSILFILVIAVLFGAAGKTVYAETKGVDINEERFPDPVFRKIAEEYNSGSGHVINCNQQHISSFKGIEFLTDLDSLYCNGNALTSLDVSKNTALAGLSCNYCTLSSLDVSNNLALVGLFCGGNQLTSLNVSNNSALHRFDCGYNQLTSLDVSNNIELQDFRCSYNQLTSLDLGDNVELAVLHCNSNQLTSLNVSKNIGLVGLECNNNQLTSLDVSNNIKLQNLSCNNNQLASLDVSNNENLAYLYCRDNQLTSLDISNNESLAYLDCRGNQLTYIDVSNSPILKYVVEHSTKSRTIDPKTKEEYYHWSVSYGSRQTKGSLMTDPDVIIIGAKVPEEESGSLGRSNELKYNYNRKTAKVAITATDGNDDRISSMEPVLVATYDEDGRFKGFSRIESSGAQADIGVGTYTVKCLWVNELLQPKCEIVEISVYGD